MKKNGFTLAELLAVIVILSLIIVIGVPTYQKTSKKAKDKMYQTKIDNASQSAKLWAIDNIVCFKTNTCTDKIDEITCPFGTTNNFTCYKITLKTLAEEGYYDYDSLDDKEILDPRDKSSLNDFEIFLKYNTNGEKITTYKE